MSDQTIKATNGTANGQAKKTATAKKTTLVKKEEKPKVSLEQRIQRVEELRSLTLKRAKALQTLHELRNFKFASSDSSTLEIRDSDGKRFNTGNTTLLSLVVSHIESLLTNKVEEMDKMILSFEV